MTKCLAADCADYADGPRALCEFTTFLNSCGPSAQSAAGRFGCGFACRWNGHRDWVVRARAAGSDASCSPLLLSLSFSELSLGSSVTPSCNSGSCSSTGAISNRRSKLVSTNLLSISPNVLTMHVLGPPPQGK